MTVVYCFNNMKNKKIVLYAFLLLGTALSIWIAYSCWNEFFRYWGLPEKEFVVDNVLAIVSIYFTLLSAAGIYTFVAYLFNRRSWKPMVKGIIINIFLLMLPLVYVLCVLIGECLWISIIGWVILLLCLYGLKQLWNMVNSFQQETVTQTESGTWTQNAEKIFSKYGLHPKKVIKTGSVITPAPRKYKPQK